MTQKHVRCFTFSEETRSDLTFSDPAKIRLDSSLRRLQLTVVEKELHTGRSVYSTDGDLYVQIASINPRALVRWLGFSATPRPTLQPAGTSVAYRLHDGTNAYYWDGGQWAVAGASDWSLEQDIVANIHTFPATSQTLSILINLATTYKYETPTLTMLDLLMEIDAMYLPSLVLDTLVPSLRENLQPIIQVSLKARGGSSFNLRDLETPYNILEVVGVYNEEDDPAHQTSLLSSYNIESKVVTLTTDVPRGDALLIYLRIELEVAFNWTDQDYIEVAKIPGLLLERLDIVQYENYAQAEVKNISTYTALVQRFPFRLSLEISVVLMAEGNRSLFSMWNEAFSFIGKVPLLHWKDFDEYVSMRLVPDMSSRGGPNLGNEHKAVFSLLLENVYLWLKPDEEKPLVQQVNLTFSRVTGN